jgi:uncharacterized protein (UPF0261 family)
LFYRCSRDDIPGRFFRSGLSGQRFWCPEADQAFVDALRKNLRDRIEVSKKAVNDPEFSSRAAVWLLELIKQKPQGNDR